MDKEDNEAIQFEKENNYEDGNAGSENSEQIEQTNVENENSKHTEQAKKKRGRATAKKVEPTKEAKPEPTPITISELEEIAKKATSFENFAKLVAEWLEMDRRQDFFTNLVIVSAEVDKITWKELEKALKDKNVVYTQWDKTWSGQQVSKKLKEYSATMLSFLNATKQYKEYSFKKANVHFIEENSTEQITEQTKPNIEEKVGKSDESIIPKTRVKMECMPEIQDFEEILARVDKIQPVEERFK